MDNEKNWAGLTDLMAVSITEDPRHRGEGEEQAWGRDISVFRANVHVAVTPQLAATYDGSKSSSTTLLFRSYLVHPKDMGLDCDGASDASWSPGMPVCMKAHNNLCSLFMEDRGDKNGHRNRLLPGPDQADLIVPAREVLGCATRPISEFPRFRGLPLSGIFHADKFNPLEGDVNLDGNWLLNAAWTWFHKDPALTDDRIGRLRAVDPSDESGHIIENIMKLDYDQWVGTWWDVAGRKGEAVSGMTVTSLSRFAQSLADNLAQRAPGIVKFPLQGLTTTAGLIDVVIKRSPFKVYQYEPNMLDTDMDAVALRIASGKPAPTVITRLGSNDRFRGFCEERTRRQVQRGRYDTVVAVDLSEV